MSGHSISRFGMMLAVAAALACSAAKTQAHTFRAHTSPGQIVRVSLEATWDGSCNALGGPYYTFTSNPAHGTISMRHESKEIKSCVAGGCTCLGKRVVGTAIYYTPAEGFHGVDLFSFSGRYPNGRVLNNHGIVEVR